jgi:hypothetical protein
MRWFRQNIRWGVRLALFTLAVHLALSFGHVHADALPYQSAAASAATMDSHSDVAPSPDRPTHPYNNSTAHDFCALCASIGLLGSLVLPDALPRLTLRDFDRVRFGHVSSSAAASLFRPFSRARAPPFA